MPGECVLDASVAGAVFFPEVQSDAAQRIADDGRRLIAPDLIFVEMASMASKKVRRGEAAEDMAIGALAGLDELIQESVPCAPLSARAFQLAAAHGLSAYDALYLVLAEERGTFVVTADERLVRRATDAGLSTLVRSLGEALPSEDS